MDKEIVKWIFFIVLSGIWGSSFILMKIGLEHLSDFQVASLRIVSAGLVLLPTTIRHIRNIPRNKIGYIFLSGLLGSFFPSFLFCIAETKIDSALAGALNALTPIFAIITGFLIFKFKIPSKKINGILIAFTGCLLLLFSKGIKSSSNVEYSLIVVLATLFYGINVNLVQKHLHQTGALKIASVALSLCAIPALLILIFTGYFQTFTQIETLKSSIAGATLGILGTAVANILFYMLIKKAGVLFSSMVTYGIPFVAIFWGFIAQEDISWTQILSLLVILLGVYIATRPAPLAAAPALQRRGSGESLLVKDEERR